MGGESSEDITGLLRELRSAGSGAAEVRERLYSALYDELRKAAAGVMRAERAGHTLQPTALVHEAYLRIADSTAHEWTDRAHFLGVATRAMRQVLVDHARRHEAAKRGGGWERVTLDEAIELDAGPSLEILDLDRALDRLFEMSPRMARVVEQRIYGAMTHGEIAESLSVSVRTVAEDWSVGRRWLARELADGTAT